MANSVGPDQTASLSVYTDGKLVLDQSTHTANSVGSDQTALV